MARKVPSASKENTEKNTESTHSVTKNKKEDEDQVTRLNRMLGAVMLYLSDDELEEIDTTYLLDNTEGLREWWEQYREDNKKLLEDEIKKSLGELSLEELENIQEQIKEKRKEGQKDQQ